MRLMASLLFNVSPLDPWTYSLATTCVIAIAWLACYLPSRRASVVNPVDALRAESSNLIYRNRVRLPGL